MDSRGLPPIQKDYDIHVYDNRNEDIFHQTSVDTGSYSNKQKSKYNNRGNRNTMQKATKINQTNIPNSTYQRNNDLFE
jgi:hypothetical protein